LPDRRGALDIGAGDGVFLERLIDCGFSRVCGVEPSVAPIEAAKPSVRSLIRRGLFDPAAFEPDSFSLITCFQVMEHLWDPLDVCRGALKLLKPGGALVAVVHNRRALSARLLGAKSPIFDIEHLQLFSTASSRRLFRLAGFSDVRAVPIWNRYPLHYWIKLFPFPATSKKIVVSYTSQARAFQIPVPLPAGNLLVWGFDRRVDARYHRGAQITHGFFRLWLMEISGVGAASQVRPFEACTTDLPYQYRNA
jgi:SAM-dependent methyltransferase